jgi:hypothetical protein
MTTALVARTSTDIDRTRTGLARSRCWPQSSSETSPHLIRATSGSGRSHLIHQQMFADGERGRCWRLAVTPSASKTRPRCPASPTGGENASSDSRLSRSQRPPHPPLGCSSHSGPHMGDADFRRPGAIYRPAIPSPTRRWRLCTEKLQLVSFLDGGSPPRRSTPHRNTTGSRTSVHLPDDQGVSPG